MFESIKLCFQIIYNYKNYSDIQFLIAIMIITLSILLIIDITKLFFLIFTLYP
jgi:hypothetical protein